MLLASPGRIMMLSAGMPSVMSAFWPVDVVPTTSTPLSVKHFVGAHVLLYDNYLTSLSVVIQVHCLQHPSGRCP